MRNVHRLIAACGAHIVQDGLIALQFVLFPVLSQALGLSYTQIGVLRAVSNTTMTLFEIPAGLLAESTGERRLLVFGLVCAAFGYAGVAFASSYFWLVFAFALAGTGAAFQHSLSSSVLARSYAAGERRRALGTYNASGDAGKLLYTALFTVAIGAGVAWNTVLMLLAICALIFAVVLNRLLRDSDTADNTQQNTERKTTAASRFGISDTRRFAVLATIVSLDSVVQAVFLTFLGFLMIEKGLGTAFASAAVVLALIGGMVGKFAAGFLAARIGDRQAFLLIQALTCGLIAALLLLPPWPSVCLLPLTGLVVQASSTICYGAVADFVDPNRQSRGYALIYTAGSAAIAAGSLGLGMLADHVGLAALFWSLVAITAATIPAGMMFKQTSNPGIKV